MGNEAKWGRLGITSEAQKREFLDRAAAFENQDVYFDYNSYTLSDPARRILDDKIAFLKRYPAVSVTVEGNCDERGTEEYNLALGQRRADAAKQYILSAGGGNFQLSTVSYGKERPVATGNDEASWQRTGATISVLNTKVFIFPLLVVSKTGLHAVLCRRSSGCVRETGTLGPEGEAMKIMRGASKKRMLLYCGGVVLAGLLAGCASTSETSTLQDNLAILNQRQAALEKRVQGEEGASSRSGDLYAQMQELEAQIRSLNGRIDEVQHKVSEIEQKQASAVAPQPPAPSTPPSGTVVIGGAPPAAQGAPPGSEAPPPASRQPQQPPQGYAPPSPGAGVYAPPQSRARPAPVSGRSAEQVEFDRGVQLLQQRNFEAARKVFQRFVSRHPDSGLGENALYYIGECCFGERHYEDAIKAFQAVVDRYPKGGKTATALSRRESGGRRSAKTLWLASSTPGL